MLVLVMAGALNMQAQSQETSTNKAGEKKAPIVEIVGKVMDRDTKMPLEFSTISLYSRKDSLLLTGTVSNADGTFSLETSHRGFFIKIEFISYLATIISEAELPENQALINLGTIELMPNVSSMTAVEILAEKSSVMLALDKRVFFVGKDLASVGGTAEDVLRNVPGLSFDNDGKFNLRGNGSIRILLNGRASSLVSNENLSGLRQIRANQIERIEIITNPSARYEAEGMAGIVNIVLKTNQLKGVNGSIDAHIGNNKNMGLGANINYNKGRFNGFLGIGVWYANRPGTGSFKNRFYNLEHPDSTIFSNMHRTHERAALPGFIKLGVDYNLNLNNTITTSFAYRRSGGENSSELTYKDALGNPNNFYQITQRLEEESEKESNLLYTLIYRKTFSKKGHQLISDIQYEDKAASKTSVFEEHYFDGKNYPLNGVDYLQLSDNEEGNRRLGFNMDYILPLKKDGKFEAGWQSAVREIFNDYEVREIINSVENPDADFTNDFLYQETIHGMYVNLGKSIHKFTLQTGLRAERSNVTTKLLTTNETNPRKYTNLFPSAFLTYSLSERNAFQLSYSRRIQRPVATDLNPFFTIRDRRNIFRGNPNIGPEYTDSYELGYIRYWEKASLSSVAYFRKTDNVIKRIQRIDADFPGVTITQAENLDFKRNYGVEFTYAYFPIQKWRLVGDVNFFHSMSEGSFQHEGQTIFVGGGSFSMETKASSMYTVWDKIHTQATFGYSAPRATTQGVNKAIMTLDVAAGTDFLKNNATLTLSVNDIFNSRRRRSFSEDETFYSEDNFLWQSRAILLSLHYRINQKKDPNRVYVNPLIEQDDEAF